MVKVLVIAALWALSAYGQNSTTGPLTNETVIRLVASGVPADTVIKTIQAASSVSFGFLPGDLALLQRYNVYDEILNAMAAKSNGRPITAPASAASPQQPPARPEPQRPATPTQSAETFNNDSVLKLVKAGMSEDVILSMVSNQPGQYTLSTDNLIALKQAGVSDKIIAAMVNRNSGGGARPTTVAQTVAPSTETITLHDATPVRLRLTRNLSSADAKTGDTADFEVLDDVKVDDVLVIARGATAIATVTQAQAKRRMARGGKLDITIDYVRLMNGDKVALRAVKETSGGGHTGAMTGAIVATSLVLLPAAPFFLFMHGKDTTIPKGTEITAYVNGEIKLDRQKLIAKP
jgi:hypothetical protein